MKNNDTLIERYPVHPGKFQQRLMQCLEIQAMRGLVLSGLGHADEAMDQIKKALFKNLTNYTCWHVYGIVHRLKKDFETAKKAYQNAHKYNPSNDSILRDLCQIQVHLRDFEGFAETRRLQLVKDPSVRENWIAYAAASYMAKNYDICLSTIESILKINVEETDKKKRPLQP